MMSDVILQYSHLTTTDTRTNITHTVVVTDGSMLIVRISITSLGSIPHHVVLALGILANQGTTTRSSNHLVTIEWQHAKLTECTQHLTFPSGTTALSSILHYRDTILFWNRHNLIAIIRHTIESNRNNRLRILTRLLLTIDNRLLQQLRIHIPWIRLRIDENRSSTKISNRMRRSTESKTLNANLITRTYATSQQTQMNGSSTSAQRHHLTRQLRAIAVLRNESLEVILKTIHVRS